MHVVLCSIFRSISPAPGTLNLPAPVKGARPDSVLGTAPPFLQGNNVADLSQMALDVVRPLGDFFTQYYERFVGKIPVKLYWLCGNLVQVEITDNLSCSLLLLLLDTVLFLPFSHQQTILPSFKFGKTNFFLFLKDTVWHILHDFDCFVFSDKRLVY